MSSETGAEILARIKPKLDEDWIEICLRPDLVASHEELESDLEDSTIADQTAQKGPRRNSDKAPAPSARTLELLERIEAVEAEMAESGVRFDFRALPKDKFRALCDQHPPRKGDMGDQSVGYHRVDLGDALVKECMTSPVFDAEAWEQLVDVVSIGEWNRLRARAEKVNGSVVTESPKSGLASAIRSSLASDSAQPPASE
jgi:hypothetical protein